MAALNDWLEQYCQDLWRETPHGALSGSSADDWADERVALMALVLQITEVDFGKASHHVIGNVSPDLSFHRLAFLAPTRNDSYAYRPSLRICLKVAPKKR